MGDLQIIIAKGKPESEGEDGEGMEEALKEASGELLSAVKSKDEEALLKAFKTLHTLCHESEDEGEEY